MSNERRNLFERYPTQFHFAWFGMACICMLFACGGSSPPVQASLTVTLTSPAAPTVYTHGIVALQVVVTGGAPDGVELLKDSAVLVALSAPYQYSWDTSATPEGSYQLSARATKGDQRFTSEAHAVVVDRTPPTVVSRTPGPGGTNIFVDDPISVSFSKPLLPASVNTGSVLLMSGATPVAATPSLSTDGKTLTLVHQGSLPVPATVTATLTSAVTDLAGNALASNAWSWSAPDWVTVGGAVNAVPGRSVETDFPNTPSLALDGTGKPVVALQESDGTATNIYVRRSNQ